MSAARMIGICLLGVGLICGVVSTAIDYWYYFSVTELGQTVKAYCGLWELCGTAVTKDIVCQSWKSLEDLAGTDIDWLHACQGLMIIGIVFNAAACGAAIYATMKQMTPRITQVTAVVAGICYLIAVSIFGAKYEKSIFDGSTGGHLHWGFALAVVAGFFNLVSTCVFAVGQSGYRSIKSDF